MNTPCTFFDDNGRITSVAELSDETLEHYSSTEAQVLIGVVGDPMRHYVVNHALAEYTEAERSALAALAPGWTWHMPDRVAVDTRDLTTTRAHKNAAINAARLAANRTSFQFGGKDIACDELSALDIASVNGIVSLTGAMPPNWIGAWKAMDNTYVAIPDHAAWISFYAAMVQTGTANFNRAQSLKAALATATTNAEIDSITWE